MNNRKQSRYFWTFFGLLMMLFLLVLLNIRGGSVGISVKELISALLWKEGREEVVSILWVIRLPRIFAGILLGGALSVSGFLLQTFFRNPIAGPYVLGISSGAKLFVAMAMIYTLQVRGMETGSFFLIFAAFLGSMISMGVVLLTAKRVASMTTLVVCGVMIGYISSAVTDFLITFADDSNIVNLHNWALGSFSGISWKELWVLTGVILPVCLLVFFLSKPMGAYQLGENYAGNLGVNIRLLRGLLIVTSSILSACVTAFAGPISFVGIAVPHLMKMIYRTAKPLVILPACFLGGAGFCLFCDLIARTLFAPTDYRFCSVTAVFGAPVVISMMLKKNSR